jgi:aminopeptidase N
MAPATPDATGAPAPRRDPHSNARPEAVAIRHLGLDLTVDFEHRVLRGTARLSLARHDRTADLIVDTEQLAIEAVTDCTTHAPVRHQLAEVQPILGAALTITPASDCVAIAYRTAPEASALLWVEPAGTSGKRKPMLFTQSQAIHARSWIPLQDSPAVRFTYEATIHVPDRLWAVMSAENPQRPPADGTWKFAMPQPVPSYLMALAVGDLAFRPIGPRTGVYAEPSVVDAAAREFVEVEAMMTAAEQLYGPYRWGRYDMLVLPPSFPFGGMENPRLTFLTPTVVTGDRSLVSVIAHELAHSWSGNLVTNATWRDFWLNEGFTTYVERRIMELLRGPAYAEVQWYLGRKDLDESMARKDADPADSRLALDASDPRGPEDLPSDAAYDKGALFLRALEEAFGREVFDRFLRRRFDRLAFQSTDTAAFEAEARAELLAVRPAAMSPQLFASWIHDPGLPPGVAPARSPHVSQLEALAAAYAAGEPGTVLAASWQTIVWVFFIRALPAAIRVDRLRALDRQYRLTRTPNAEIATYWLPVMIRGDAREAMPAIEAFLLRVGRVRMVRPIYEAMLTQGEPWRALAKRIFAKASPLYHPVTREAIAKLVARS